MLKRFKSRFAILAIVAVAAISGGAALASTASAANCTSISAGPTYYDGNMNFLAKFSGCSGVDGFRTYVVANQGWWDTDYMAWEPTTGTVNNYGFGTAQSSWSGIAGSHAPWCGGAVHHVTRQFLYSIHNLSQGTWGPDHWFTAPGEIIQC